MAAVLVHDGQPTPTAQLVHAEPGQHVEVKGDPEPFYPDGSLRDWQDILPLLDAHTYVLQQGPLWLLLTAADEAPQDVVVAEGNIAWTGEHPHEDAPLVIVNVTQWREPLLFR